MKRKSLLLGLAVVLTLAVIFTVLGALLSYVPPFYRDAEIAAGPERKNQALKFASVCVQIYNGMKQESRWGTDKDHPITDELINSFLAENFATEGWIGKLFPSGVSDPRVSMEDGKIRLAFCYGRKPWSTIVSLEVRVWLVPREYNIVALELESIRAGLLPISVQSVLEGVTEALRKQSPGLEFNWYRNNGHPVALMRLEADKQVPRIRLQEVSLQKGKLYLYGCDFASQPNWCPAEAGSEEKH